jgi:alcohol dehydrogenase
MLTPTFFAHHFDLNDIMTAYDTFGNAAKEKALKVILKN